MDDRTSSAELADDLYDFPLEESPTLPLRGSSGKFIKSKVIAAMTDQHSAAVSVNRDLDELILKTQQCMVDKIPPPPDTTQR